MYNYLLEGRILKALVGPISVFFVALFISVIITPIVRRLAISYGAIDHPKSDDRRIHERPTPRWGGVAIYISICSSLFVLYPFLYPNTFPYYLGAILICGGLIVIMGAWDDVKPLNAKFQFVYLMCIGLLVQFLSGENFPLQIKNIESVLLTLTGVAEGNLSLGNFAWPITAIYIFIATKTMDTIDGLDGLSAGLAGIGSLALVILAIYLDQPKIALISASVVGSCIGFLRYNFNPAVIFMGTGGAQLLGFILACTSIIGFVKHISGFYIFLPFAIFGIPFFDACFVIIRRLAAKQPISQADKRHVHHTLMKQGLNQRQTVLILYFIALILCSILLNLFISGDYVNAKT